MLLMLFFVCNVFDDDDNNQQLYDVKQSMRWRHRNPGKAYLVQYTATKLRQIYRWLPTEVDILRDGNN
jgi:hypothetical protein